MFGYADKQKRMTSPPQAAACSAVPTAESADESEVVATKMAMARPTWHKVGRRRWLTWFAVMTLPWDAGDCRDDSQRQHPQLH
jgi:hypothetical protein